MEAAKPIPSRFDYVKFDARAQEDQEVFKAHMQGLEIHIESFPAGRYKSLALTALEEAYAWIGKMVRDEQISRNQGAFELQEQRTDS